MLDAVVAVLARGGIAAVSMRAVAKEAGVALGLMNYYFDDKTALIAAALRRIGESDARLVEPVEGLAPEEQLRLAMRRVVDPELLDADYLGVRLQLWSLARVDPEFARINHEAQITYRQGLAALIGAARPEFSSDEVARRAADVLVVQNGMWLTSILIVETEAIERSVALCESISLGPT